MLAWIIDQPMLPIQWSSFPKGYTPYKFLTLATNTMFLFFKIPKHEISWSRELHLSSCIGPRSASAISVKRRSEEGIPSYPCKSARFIDSVEWKDAIEGYAVGIELCMNLLCWLLRIHFFPQLKFLESVS